MAFVTPGRIYTLRLVPPDQAELFKQPADVLRTVFSPGSRTERYRRIWIIGGVSDSGSQIEGRLGAQSAGRLAELFDEETQDFVEYRLPVGTTVPFVVDLARSAVAVQARRPEMKISAIIGAVRRLIQEEQPGWRVIGSRTETSLAAWLSTVDRVQNVAFTIRKPNPHYADAHDVKSLMDQFAAETTRLEIGSDAPGGVDLGGPFAQQTQAHVDRGYGEAVYQGERSSPNGVVETVYSTEWGGEEVYDEAPVDQETGEVEHGALRKAIEAVESSDDEAGSGNAL